MYLSFHRGLEKSKKIACDSGVSQVCIISFYSGAVVTKESVVKEFLQSLSALVCLMVCRQKRAVSHCMWEKDDCEILRLNLYN